MTRQIQRTTIFTLPACIALAWLATAPAIAECLSGTLDGASFCVTSKEVVMQPADGDHADAIWSLVDSEGLPLAEGTGINIDTKQRFTTAPPGMPPLDVTYLERVGADGRLVFHCEWTDRMMTLKIIGSEDGSLSYVGDGDQLAIDTDG